MKTRLLAILAIAIFLVPLNPVQGLPVFLDCTYDSDFIMSTNKLEFVPDETFVLDVKTKQNDTSFEISVMNPKGQEVFADVVDIIGKNNYAQTRFHILDNAEKGTWSVFVTANPSHQQEVVFIGVNEIPQSQLSIKSLFANYKYKFDDASFLIAGKPNTDVQVNVLDHNTEKTNIYIITLAPEGKCSFALDLDGYKPGVYDVEISDYDDDVSAVFTVGMQPTTGVMAVSLFSDSYFFGDDVFASIETLPEIDLSVEVKDPSGNIVDKFGATSEKNGTLHTYVSLPEYGEDGTWTITARSGANFDTIGFNVSQGIQDNAHLRTPGGSVPPDITVYPVPWDGSPLKQLKSGITIDEIQCDDLLVLVTKHDASPACVKPETKTKLTERGWVKNECARLFDTNMNAFSKIVDEQDDLNLQTYYGVRQNDLVFSSEFFKEWRDYGCVGTVNDWANMSEYENFISQVVNWDKQK